MPGGGGGGGELVKVIGVEFSPAKIAWALCHGVYPSHVIFTKDGDSYNLVSSNLSMGKKTTSARATEYPFIRRSLGAKTYEARITINGSRKHFYGFKNPESAHAFILDKSGRKGWGGE